MRARSDAPDSTSVECERADGTAALVERALAREPWALRTLVDRLRGGVQWEVKAVLERYAPGRRPRALRQDLEDLVQDIFYALFTEDARALRAWNPTGGRSLENFVRWYARRQAISIVRTGRRRPWLDEVASEEEVDEASAPHDDILPALEARSLLSALLERLPLSLGPEQLRLFDLSFVEERSPADICVELDLEPDVVYARLSRLRRAVRSLAEALLAEAPPRGR